MTLFTLEWFLTAVHQLMPSQVRPLVKIAVALIAFVSSLLTLLVRIRIFNPGIRDEHRLWVDNILRVVNALLIGRQPRDMVTYRQGGGVTVVRR